VAAADAAWKAFLSPFNNDLRVRLIRAEINTALKRESALHADL
jgi:hypothetical protein